MGRLVEADERHLWVFKRFARGRKDGSVSKVLTIQAPGPQVQFFRVHVNTKSTVLKNKSTLIPIIQCCRDRDSRTP